MLYYNVIDINKGINPAKSNNSKKCTIYHYWFFNYGFGYQKLVCNGCHDLTMLCLTFSDIVIITVKGVNYRCIIGDTSKSAAIHLLENSVPKDCGYI